MRPKGPFLLVAKEPLFVLPTITGTACRCSFASSSSLSCCSTPSGCCCGTRFCRRGLFNGGVLLIPFLVLMQITKPILICGFVPTLNACRSEEHTSELQSR